MRGILFVLMLCFVASVALSNRHYTEEAVEVITRQKNSKKPVLKRQQYEEFMQMLHEGMGNDLLPVVNRCRQRGCYDVQCCIDSLSIKMRQNELVVEIIKREWENSQRVKDDL
jgi:hypothetical protein